MDIKFGKENTYRFIGKARNPKDGSPEYEFQMNGNVLFRLYKDGDKWNRSLPDFIDEDATNFLGEQIDKGNLATS
jgi:hypothetical protein